MESPQLHEGSGISLQVYGVQELGRKSISNRSEFVLEETYMKKTNHQNFYWKVLKFWCTQCTAHPPMRVSGVILQIQVLTRRSTARGGWGEGGKDDASNCLRTHPTGGAPPRTVPLWVRTAVSW